MSDILKECLVNELTSRVDDAVTAFAQHLAGQFPQAPMAILFYGSLLRHADPDGILDFYIITERWQDFSGSFMNRLMNRLLPPNVRYVEMPYNGKVYRAKVATLSYRQFFSRTSLKTTDTTIWARFAQPVRLIWVKDPRSADKILDAIWRCVITASLWAALLGPNEGPSEDYWHSLFARTYKAELRVEKKGRSRNIMKGQEARYTECLLAAWKAAGLGVTCKDSILRPHITDSNRQKAEHQWKHIEKCGKPLNLIRLVKAAFTFDNGLSYLVWKIERHTGHKPYVSEFEKKHPVLCLPLVLWHFRRVRS